MTAATHPVAPEEIMALVDRELPSNRAQAVAVHVQSCSECGALTQQFQSATRTLSSWKVDTPSSLLDEHIRAAAAKRFPRTKSLGTAISQPTGHWTWKRWLAGLSAAAVILLFSFAIVTRRHRFAGSEAVIRAAKSFPEKGMREVTEADIRPYARPARIAEGRGYGRGVVSGDTRKAVDNASVDYFNANGALGKLQTDQSLDQQSWLQKGPMIARTVSLSIIVKDFDASRNSLDAILARHNGYSANLTVSTPQGTAKSLQASLRIPAPQLNAAVAELKSLGRVENESQNGEEVTQQHADLVARLKNSRETEQRLQAILTQRTGKISDVLEVEQEIARVRGEIEQMEAEQKNLEHRVDFATVDLKLSEEYKAKLESAAPSISTQIHNALVNGYRNVADTLLALILFFAEDGPVLLLWCVFLLVPAYFLWRRWRTATASA